MNIKIIYLDLDGVLVDLEHILEQLEGRTIKQVLEQESNGNIAFDPFMWLIRKHITKEPFVHAKPMPDFHQFYHWIENWMKDGYSVKILSSASRDETLYPIIVEQKKKWLLHHNLGHLECCFSHGGRQKSEVANPECILIDDYWENVDYFKNKGGQAILHKNMIDTERFLLQRNLVKLPKP